jgi:hypothetical protein
VPSPRAGGRGRRPCLTVCPAYRLERHFRLLSCQEVVFLILPFLQVSAMHPTNPQGRSLLQSSFRKDPSTVVLCGHRDVACHRGVCGGCVGVGRLPVKAMLRESTSLIVSGHVGARRRAIPA